MAAAAETFAGVPVMRSKSMKDDRLRLLLHGSQGSGKTRLASSIAALGPTLFIDMVGERGTKSFQGTPWEEQVTILRPTTVQQLDDIYWQLAKGGHGYKAVVLDSISATQKTAMRFLLGHEETAVREIQKGGSTADQRTWGRLADVLTDIATFWYGLADGDRKEPMHVVMTSQTKKMETDEGEFRAYPDVSPASRNILLATASYVLFTDQEEIFEDDGTTKAQWVVRLGFSPKHYTKARIPANLQGKVPDVLGRKEPLTLDKLCKALSIPT